MQIACMSGQSKPLGDKRFKVIFIERFYRPWLLKVINKNSKAAPGESQLF